MGHEHDVPKGFISLTKAVLNNGVVGGTGRKHVRGSEELGHDERGEKRRTEERNERV
jgi:hypothetical protein